jgi:hypothetical protein
LTLVTGNVTDEQQWCRNPGRADETPAAVTVAMLFGGLPAQAAQLPLESEQAAFLGSILPANFNASPPGGRLRAVELRNDARRTDHTRDRPERGGPDYRLAFNIVRGLFAANPRVIFPRQPE